MNHESPGRWAPKRNALIVLAALIAVGVLAWVVTHATGGVGKTAGRNRPPTTVGIAHVQRTDMPINLPAIGTVQPIVTATVRTQLAGQLFSLHFTEGQMVEKGDLLAEVDPRPYRLALALAEANLARDTAIQNQAKIDLGRDQTLLEQDSIARQDVETQAAVLKQSVATVAADKAAVATAKLNVEYTAITAPVAGRIGLRQADIGNYLTPGDANGIAVITQVTPIDVTFSLPQSQLPVVQQKLGAGATLPVTVSDQWDAAVLAHGEFLTLDNQIDPTSGTVKAKARFLNPDGTLFPNQFVNVIVSVDTLQDALTVPISAVRHGADGDFVFLLQPDSTVKAQVVKTGAADNEKIAILSGAEASATVITEGADGLDDGSHVKLPAGQSAPPADRVATTNDAAPPSSDKAHWRHGTKPAPDAAL